MALDFLNISGKLVYLINKTRTNPDTIATSTSVEWIFSQGCHLLSFSCNRLSSKTVRASLCLGSWSRNDLIIIANVMAAVNSGTKKRKLASQESVEV